MSENPGGPKKLGYTITEAAARLGVSPRTVRNFVTRKLLRKCKSLRAVRIPASDVENFYERNSSSRLK